MNKMLRAIVAIVCVGIITFSVISICQKLFKGIRLDITERKLYTLSDGTRNILNKLTQPIRLKLYYTKTAANKGPDQIRYFNEYYFYVKALLEEYGTQSKGMVELEVIDPRPFSDEEAEALRYGLSRMQLTQDESFFFGLVLETQLGVSKTIEIFQPDRQQFVEYEISHLIDTAITREKKRIGVLSSLPVMGDDMSPYMRQMMQMQNQQAKEPWVMIKQLQQQFEVSKVDADSGEITDIDLLLLIHPKELPEKTQFAIDQFVLKGGRVIACVDPHCYSDQPPQMPGQQQFQAMANHKSNSDLGPLLGSWGLEMPERTFAGDLSLAEKTQLRQNAAPQVFIGLMGLNRECMNSENLITAELNQVRTLFPGVLKPKVSEPVDGAAPAIEHVRLLQTTARGNSWMVESAFELTMGMDPDRLMQKFRPGDKPVAMGYLVKGRFQSSFPNGIEVEDQSAVDAEPSVEDPEAETEDPPKMKKLTGLTETAEGEESVVVVFADVDFISDMMAFSRAFFGMTSAVGDNSALLLNAIEDLSGSTDLLSIRTRGNYRRPFKVIDEIEEEAEAENAEKIQSINGRITGFQSELQQIAASAKEGEEKLIGAEIVKKKKEIELEIHEANRDLRRVQQSRREKIEAKQNKLKAINLFTAPAVILLAAIGLGARRSMLRRSYSNEGKD